MELETERNEKIPQKLNKVVAVHYSRYSLVQGKGGRRMIKTNTSITTTDVIHKRKSRFENK